MVGIVIVSHSALIAEGAAELARQMGGDAPIAAAGGVDDPDNPIGTDATRVLAAIEEVWSDDGVVVLMDLGSAILSTDFALDLLDEDQRRRVVMCDAPVVEGAVAAATAAGAGASIDDVVREARAALLPKAAAMGTDAAGSGEVLVPAEPGEAGDGVSTTLPVANPTGLHARPAARFVATVGGFDAEVAVSNLTTGAGPVRGDSFTAIGTLGARQGHEIEVTASGQEAAAVVEALRHLAADGYGDEPAAVPTTEPTPITAGPVGASPGTAIGPVRHLAAPVVTDADPGPVGDPATEIARLTAAIERAAGSIGIARDAARGIGEAEAGIFEAHLLLLADAELIDEVHSRIEAGDGAVRGWRSVIAEISKRFGALDDPYQRERAGDIEAVGRQVLAELLGVDATVEPSGVGILVAVDLDPAQTARLDPTVVHGIVTAGGGPTSHSAILARALGIPAVVAAGPDVLEIPEGTTVVIDGDTGGILVDPEDEILERAGEAVEAERRAAAAAAGSAGEPAITGDGHIIEVAANIGSTADAETAIAAGADGIGLLRTEFLFLGRATPPDEAEQERAYRTIAETLDGRRLVLRTLDIGGDKPLPFVRQPAEANPFLGVRGLRLGLRDPELLGGQLRAVVKVAADYPVSLMFPMVTTVEEVLATRAMVEGAVVATGVEPAASFEIGVMVEVPALALLADRLAPHVDFFSIGTNDLTQYVMAVERGHAALAGLADPLHPAVLRLVSQVCAAGKAHHAWVGVCGEAAGDLEAVPVLLGLGVTELSTASATVPAVKQAVRRIDLAAASNLAEEALELDGAAEVRAAVRRFLATREI